MADHIVIDIVSDQSAVTKQDVINNGVLTFAKTAGLQAAINAQNKLASRIYVDNELIGKQNTLIAGTNISISGNTISSKAITQTQLDTKQDILTAGTNITISGNTCTIKHKTKHFNLFNQYTNTKNRCQ